jgi:hypothetical protein
MDTCGGATRVQLRAAANGAVKVLIPRKMETPVVGMRMGAEHEDSLITKDFRTYWLKGECLFRVTNEPLFYSVKQVYLN